MSASRFVGAGPNPTPDSDPSPAPLAAFRPSTFLGWHGDLSFVHDHERQRSGASDTYFERRRERLRRRRAARSVGASAGESAESSAPDARSSSDAPADGR